MVGWDDPTTTCGSSWNKISANPKYETGANRVSASRLWDIAKSLQVDISFFFEGIEGDEAQVEAGVAPSDVLSDKEALELLRSYYAIPENQRRRLFDLARVLSDVS